MKKSRRTCWIGVNEVTLVLTIPSRRQRARRGGSRRCVAQHRKHRRIGSCRQIDRRRQRQPLARTRRQRQTLRRRGQRLPTGREKQRLPLRRVGGRHLARRSRVRSPLRRRRRRSLARQSGRRPVDRRSIVKALYPPFFVTTQRGLPSYRSSFRRSRDQAFLLSPSTSGVEPSLYVLDE